MMNIRDIKEVGPWEHRNTNLTPTAISIQE